MVERIASRIDALHSLGTVSVAASGNAVGSFGSQDEAYNAPNYPACIENVISVGALSKPSEDDISSILESGGYPNAQLWDKSVTKSDTDLVAYGDGITVLSLLPYDLPGFVLLEGSGTSYAAPQVSAAAALVKKAHPNYTADQIKRALVCTAVKLPGMQGANRTAGYGYGALDVASSLKWTPASPSSPSTGVEDLAAEEVAGQIASQYTQQSIPIERVETAFSYARAANPEVVAWLYVPGTNVSLPVCRHEGDDSYYLEHDSRRRDSALGAAYMEEADSAAFDQALTVLYGHSFPNVGLMFTGLHAFEDVAFFRGHEYIYVLTEDGWLTYRVVEAAYYTDGHIAGMADESDEASVQAYFDAFADDDPEGFIGFRRPCELDAGTDRVLQLSTCTLPATDGARFVVSAVLVD